MKQKSGSWNTFPGAPTKWSRPTIRPLFRLGELTTPTTFSASSPDRHRSDISELREDFGGVPGAPAKCDLKSTR